MLPYFCDTKTVASNKPSIIKIRCHMPTKIDIFSIHHCLFSLKLNPQQLFVQQQYIKYKATMSLQSNSKLIFNKKQQGKPKKFFKWSCQEEQQYLDFLKQIGKEMNNQYSRRSCKVFAKMAEVLPTRNAEQCRTHHQKMVLAHPDLNSIIKYVEAKIARKRDQKKYEKKVELKAAKENADKKLITSTNPQVQVCFSEKQLENEEWLRYFAF